MDTTTAPTRHLRPLAQMARAVAVRPDLWWTAARLIGATIPRRWWRTRPYLPVPDRRYLGFRLQTQYGGLDAVASGEIGDDVVRYLRWCREWRSAR